MSLQKDLYERHDGLMSWAEARWHCAARLSTSLVRIIFQRTRSEDLHLDKRVNWHRHAPCGGAHSLQQDTRRKTGTTRAHELGL